MPFSIKYHNLLLLAFSWLLTFSLQENIKSLYRTLIAFLSHSNLTVIVFSLSILTSLSLHEQLGEKVLHINSFHWLLSTLVYLLYNLESYFLELIKYYSSRNQVYNFVGICKTRDSHEDCKRGGSSVCYKSRSGLVGVHLDIIQRHIKV